MNDFQTFCENYLSGFTHQVGQRRSLGLEKEIILTDARGNMGNVVETMWPYFVKNGFTPEYDTYYKDEITGFNMKERAHITTEAGKGTFEVILDPIFGLNECEAVMKRALRHCYKSIQSNPEARIVSLAYQPLQPPLRENWNHKQRYEVLVDVLGQNVMTATLSASDQVHVDIAREEFVPVTNLMSQLTGLFMVLFANSPISEGKPAGEYVCREMIWDDLGTERTGVFDTPLTSAEDYLSRVWKLPCIMMKGGEKYYAPRKNFDELMKGKNGSEIFESFKLHEGAVWFCARPRFFGTVEIRPTCLQPWDAMLSVPALMLGLIENWKNVEEFTKDLEWNEWIALRKQASQEGFALKIKGKPVGLFLKELIDLAAEGLLKQGEPLTHLDPLYERVNSGKNPHDRALDCFSSNGLPAVIDQNTLRPNHIDLP